jgi:hypothetical protein
MSKTAEQQPSAANLMHAPLVAATGPSSLATLTKVTLGLVACDHDEARISAHRVLQFNDRMKSVVDDQEGE